MKHKIWFLILVISCIPFSSFAQQFQQFRRVFVKMNNSSEKPHEIVYRKGHLLRIKDFEGKEEKGMSAIAMAYSGVNLQYTAAIKNKEILVNITMYPFFDKQRSWFLEEHKNEKTLAHEQLHFDITVIKACELYRALKATDLTENVEKEIVELQTKYRIQNEDEQDRYDSETNHGINKEKQAEWNEKIKQQLAACADCYE